MDRKGVVAMTEKDTVKSGVPAALLEPGYWDTDPEDYVMNGAVPSWELEHRFAGRRSEFTALLNRLEEEFDLYDDESDWGVDEAWQSYFIPVSQVEEAHKLIAELGFDYEESENTYEDSDEETTNLWVIDPVVSALQPENYNIYTRRGIDPYGDWQARGGDLFRSDPTLTHEERWGWAPPVDGPEKH